MNVLGTKLIGVSSQQSQQHQEQQLLRTAARKKLKRFFQYIQDDVKLLMLMDDDNDKDTYAELLETILRPMMELDCVWMNSFDGAESWIVNTDYYSPLVLILDRLDNHIMTNHPRGGVSNEGSRSCTLRWRILTVLSLILQLTSLSPTQQLLSRQQQSTQRKQYAVARYNTTFNNDHDNDVILDIQDRLWQSIRTIMMGLSLLESVSTFNPKFSLSNDVGRPEPCDGSNRSVQHNATRAGRPTTIPPSVDAIVCLAIALKETYVRCENHQQQQQQQQRRNNTERHELGETRILDMLYMLTKGQQQSQHVQPLMMVDTEDAKIADLRWGLHVAWGCYVATLCRDSGDYAEKDKLTNTDEDEQDCWNRSGIDMAARLLLWKEDSGASMEAAAAQNFGITPNIVCYNTVLLAAAKSLNVTLVESLWQDCLLKKKELDQNQDFDLPDYDRTRDVLDQNGDISRKSQYNLMRNARLRVNKDMDRRLEIFDQEIVPGGDVFDVHTINLLIPPLVRAKRKNDLFRLLDGCTGSASSYSSQPNQGQKIRRIRHMLSNAFLSFLHTMIYEVEDVVTAREIFDRYMMVGDDIPNGQFRHNKVTPTTKHFNILLDGYAKQAAVAQKRLQHFHDIGYSASNDGTPIDIGDSDHVVGSDQFYQTTYEDAIARGQDLFHRMVDKNRLGPVITPDEYTWSIMMKLCKNGAQVQNLIREATKGTRVSSDQRALLRSAVSTCGKLGDPSMACILFDRYVMQSMLRHKRESSSSSSSSAPSWVFSDCRACNALLGALAAGAKRGNPILDVKTNRDDKQVSSEFMDLVHNNTCTEAGVVILNWMGERNPQTYSFVISALQYATNRGNVPESHTTTTTPSTLAIQIFRNAAEEGIESDGRLVNAVIRCFADNIDGAIVSWKTELRKYCVGNGVNNPYYGNRKKNLLAAYSGLLYVCGRALRPDIALRVVYAMKKDGIDPSEHAYYNYRHGRMTRNAMLQQPNNKREREGKVNDGDLLFPKLPNFFPRLDMVTQCENLLFVECKKYHTKDRRLEDDMKVRIIM